MLRRLTGFTVLPLVSLVTPFVLMPLVARAAGPAGWGSFLAGQAVGTVGATVVFWGWNVGGPVAVAQAAAAGERAAVYASSLRTRYALLAVVAPVVAVVSAVVAEPGHRLDAVAVAVATTLLGLSPSWYGIGAGEPWLLFWYDTVPRVAAAALGAVTVWATGLVWTYPVFLAASFAVSLPAFQRRVVPGAADMLPWPPRRALGELRHHLGAAGINLAATAYASTPVPVATLAFRAEVSSRFASADAAYRLGLFTVTAMGNAFQGWTLAPDLADRRARQARHRVALLAHTVLGVVGATAFTVLGPWVTGVVFGADVAAPRDVCLYYGLSFLFVSASTPPIRNLLLPAGRARLVLAWTLASAVVGLGTMVGAALAGWSGGVAAGMALSELVLLCGLLAPALRLATPPSATGLRSLPGSGPPGPQTRQTTESGGGGEG